MGRESRGAPKRTLKHVLLYDLCCAGVDTLCSFGKCDLPSEEDWLSCDLCDGWYHCKCMGVNLQEAEEEEFICPSCSCY